MLLPTLKDAIKRLVYLFCNPVEAKLCDSIDQYPGLSSWNAFCTCEASVDATVVESAPWHPVSTLPEIGPRGLSKEEDSLYVDRLASSKAAVSHILVLKPLAWLGLFGIVEAKDIEAIRQEVIQKVYAREAELREERQKATQTTVSTDTLQAEPYLKPHKPKKKERKIFVICSDTEARISWIKFFQGVFRRCAECYQMAKKGVAATWPLGTFIPWLPPTECCVGR